MSTAKYCKKCPMFVAGNSFYKEHNKVVSQYNDWCDERVSAWKAWGLAQ